MPDTETHRQEARLRGGAHGYGLFWGIQSPGDKNIKHKQDKKGRGVAGGMKNTAPVRLRRIPEQHTVRAVMVVPTSKTVLTRSERMPLVQAWMVATTNKKVEQENTRNFVLGVWSTLATTTLTDPRQIRAKKKEKRRRESTPQKKEKGGLGGEAFPRCTESHIRSRWRSSRTMRSARPGDSSTTKTEGTILVTKSPGGGQHPQEPAAQGRNHRSWAQRHQYKRRSWRA